MWEHSPEHERALLAVSVGTFHTIERLEVYEHSQHGVTP
jgi:hypothetical protein